MRESGARKLKSALAHIRSEGVPSGVEMDPQFEWQLVRELELTQKGFKEGDSRGFGSAAQVIGEMILRAKFVFEPGFELFEKYGIWDVLCEVLERSVKLAASRRECDSVALKGAVICLRGLSLTSEYCEIIEKRMLESLVALTKVQSFYLKSEVKEQMLRLFVNLAGETNQSLLRGNGEIINFVCNGIYQCGEASMYVPALNCLVFLVEDHPITDVILQKNILEALFLAIQSMIRFGRDGQFAEEFSACREFVAHVLLRLTETKSIEMPTFHARNIGKFIKENFWIYRTALLYTITLFIRNYPDVYMEEIGVTWDDLGRNLEVPDPAHPLDNETMAAYSFVCDAMCELLKMNHEIADGETVGVLVSLFRSYWENADFAFRWSMSRLYLQILRARSETRIDMAIIGDSITVFTFIVDLGYDSDLSMLFRDILIRCHVIAVRLTGDSDITATLTHMAKQLSDEMTANKVPADQIAPLTAEFASPL